MRESGEVGKRIGGRAGRLRSAEAREQEASAAAVFLEGVSELRGEHGFFFLRLEGEGNEEKNSAEHGAPTTNEQDGPDGGGEQAGVDGMAKTGIRAGANEFVAFFDGDAAAPIRAEIKSGPDGQPKAKPDNDQSGDDDGKSWRQKAHPQNADTGSRVEEQNIADDDNKHDAIARGEGFFARGGTGHKRADEPDHKKDQPGKIERENQVVIQFCLSFQGCVACTTIECFSRLSTFHPRSKGLCGQNEDSPWNRI
jgi:hypothetical protein